MINGKLTASQEKFVQELVKNGGNKTAAYKAAYPDSRENGKNLTTLACREWKKVGVQSRYDQLRAEADTKAHKAVMETVTANVSTMMDAAKSATDMRAFIIAQYAKIASGEICDESTTWDGENNVVKKDRKVRATDVANALGKLAEYYGVAPEVQQSHEVVVRYEGAEEYAD